MDFEQLKSQQLGTWKDKYMAALFELDKEKLNDRITDAEIAVARRTRELFQTDDQQSHDAQLRERQSLEAAFYAFRALRSVTGPRRTNHSSVHDKRPFAASPPIA
jgi:hypothetical protein